MKELKKEVRLPNYCPKCKVNLAASDTCTFICYEMECGGIVLSQETLIEFENNKLNMKKTKDLLIEMMQANEELGSYQEEHKKYNIMKKSAAQDANEWVNKVMDDFDYEKVQKVMKFLDWTWFTSDETPTIGELRATSRKRLEKAFAASVKHKTIFSNSSGGFTAKSVWDKRYNKVVELSLSFVLEENFTFND